jgi:hypothetical protein
MWLQDRNCPAHSREPGLIEGLNILNASATNIFSRRNRFYRLSQHIESLYIIQNVY